VYLDPADMERPIAFNVLDGVRPDQHAVAPMAWSPLFIA
jgi:hypothetical protein